MIIIITRSLLLPLELLKIIKPMSSHHPSAMYRTIQIKSVIRSLSIRTLQMMQTLQAIAIIKISPLMKPIIRKQTKLKKLQSFQLIKTIIKVTLTLPSQLR